MICTTGPKRRRGPSILASTKLAIGTMEHVGALDTIGEIVSTPGLDLVFIGPGDLATSMGLRGHVDHTRVQAAMKALEGPIRNSPVVLGGVATTPEQANAMQWIGIVRVELHSVSIMLLRQFE